MRASHVQKPPRPREHGPTWPRHIRRSHPIHPKSRQKGLLSGRASFILHWCAGLLLVAMSNGKCRIIMVRLYAKQCLRTDGEIDERDANRLGTANQAMAVCLEAG